MAASPALPPEVLALLAQALPSMVHIELLLLVFRTEPQEWEVGAAADEVRTSPALAAAAFVDLETARLVETVPGSDGTSYRLAQLTPAARSATAALQETYDRRPVSLVRALYQRPRSPVQAFADAFRVRPEDR